MPKDAPMQNITVIAPKDQGVKRRQRLQWLDMVDQIVPEDPDPEYSTRRGTWTGGASSAFTSFCAPCFMHGPKPSSSRRSSHCRGYGLFLRTVQRRVSHPTPNLITTSSKAVGKLTERRLQFLGRTRQNFKLLDTHVFEGFHCTHCCASKLISRGVGERSSRSISSDHEVDRSEMTRRPGGHANDYHRWRQAGRRSAIRDIVALGGDDLHGKVEYVVR